MVAKGKEEKEWGETGFCFGEMEKFCKWIKVVAIQHCEHIKCHCTVHFKMVTPTVYEFHHNKLFVKMHI